MGIQLPRVCVCVSRLSQPQVGNQAWGWFVCLLDEAFFPVLPVNWATALQLCVEQQRAHVNKSCRTGIATSLWDLNIGVYFSGHALWNLTASRGSGKNRNTGVECVARPALLLSPVPCRKGFLGKDLNLGLNNSYMGLCFSLFFFPPAFPPWSWQAGFNVNLLKVPPHSMWTAWLEKELLPKSIKLPSWMPVTLRIIRK